MEHEHKKRGLVLPVTAAIISLLLFLSASFAISYYTISQNNSNQQKYEQQAITTAIAQNNKSLCDIIVTINASTKGASDANHASNSYSLRLQKDFLILDQRYKCG